MFQYAKMVRITGGGGGGPTVNFPSPMSADGVTSAAIRINNGGTWEYLAEGAPYASGTWLTSGTASEVTGTLTHNSGATTSGMVKGSAVNLGTTQTISISTSISPQSNQSTLVIKRASDGTTLQTITISLSVSGNEGGGMTMSL